MPRRILWSKAASPAASLGPSCYFNHMIQNDRGANLSLCLRKSLSILSVLLLWAVSAYAQVTTADVVGTVHDPSGAVIANAKVEITNKGTGLTRTAETGSSGDFVINSLPPGTYLVKVEAPRFKTYTVPDLTLASGDRTRVDANMQPGQTSETVEVTAATPLLQTDSSTLQSTV